ncbi:MAG TPA: type III pantothenate kinase [Casimicrobiaceae bacterium]|nr:type III pantothenate kinase [Casimicrobiaceae bacterium]
MANKNTTLLVDIGNTFLKWGLFERDGDGLAFEHRLDSGHVLLDETTGLARVFTKFAMPSQIVISNVAGIRMRGMVGRLLEVWKNPETGSAPAAHWIVPQAEQCGVVNCYRNPAQLGSDRWAALIGARKLMPDEPVLVVVCGTVTTVDFLSQEGEFRGGFIVPGVGLMLRSLHEGTAGLPDAEGELTELPQQTVDATYSGCLHAQAGAVERIFGRLVHDTPALTCLVSGGAGPALAPRLAIAYRLHENLVLEGLYRISADVAKT